MVYATPFPPLFIYWSVSIAGRAWFVLRIWKSIITDFIATSHKIIYNLSSSCMNRSLTGIGSDRTPPLRLLLSTIFKHMCLTTFSDDYNPPLNTVQLMVSKVLMFNENIELLPSGDCYDLSPGNNDPTKHTTLVLVRTPVRNQLGWVEVAKEDWAWGTNSSSIFSRSAFDITNYSSSVKIALAAPKIMYIDTYRIFFNALSYASSVKGNNQDAEITSTIASKVIKLSSIYTEPFLLAEFIQIVWIQLVLLFIS